MWYALLGLAVGGIIAFGFVWYTMMRGDNYNDDDRWKKV